MSDGVCPRCNRQGKEDYKEKTVEVIVFSYIGANND